MRPAPGRTRRRRRPRGPTLAAILAVACASLADAQTDPAAPAADEAPRVSLRANLEWITAVRGTDPSETSLNPGNATFRLPQLVWITDVRPNVRLEIGPRWQLVARPRWRGTIEQSWATGLPRQDRARGTAEMTELYANWRPADAVSFAYGLQNFQWGPAELLGPSNRIFHEVGIFRDPLYSVRGKHLARVNVSAGKQWSLVALADLGATSEAPFRAGAPFERAAQAKLEFTTASGASYIGVTGGARLRETPWFGTYGALAVTEGLSAYLDASLQRGSEAWYPVATAPGAAAFETADRGSGHLRVLAVAGLRYTFVSGVDARVEYVHQDAGYSSAQSDLSALAVATEATRAAVEQWLAPGLEFLGRRLALVSVRVPDLEPADRLDVQGRYLVSFTDRSGVVFVTSSLEAADALVLFGSATFTYGREFAEFARLARASVVVGAVWSW